jgi:6-phosphogluconolactonase
MTTRNGRIDTKEERKATMQRHSELCERRNQGFTSPSSYLLFAVATAVVTGALLIAAAPAASAHENHGRHAVGAVYTLSNEAAGNAVVVFQRATDGTLSAAGSVPTGGLGSGAELGSQGALTFDEGGHLLFAVNAGSNTVSVLRVENGMLSFVDSQPSGGTAPISLTEHDGLLYVLNAGGDGDIAGFRVADDGTLAPIPGSTQPLSGAGVAPAQIGFDGDGDVLVVTEKATNMIDTYMVDDTGVAVAPLYQPSAGSTPYGFGFGRRNLLLVSEAFGGAANASATSSYSLAEDGTLSVVSASVPTHQTAACWVAVTGNGRYAYTTNTGSASTTGYRVDRRTGTITLLDPSGVTGETGSTPIDVALTREGRFLYTLNFSDGTISEFEVGADGDLTAIGSVSGLPASVGGLAAR